MAVGNLGAVKNLLEGFLAHEFIANGVPTNQGLSLLPEMVERIASRADLTYTNLRVTAPAAFAATNVDVESGAVGLIAVVISNDEAANDTAVAIYGTTTVTEGTTDPLGGIYVVGQQECKAFVLPEPLPLAALSYSAMLGTEAGIEAGTLSTSGAVTVMLVYAE